MLYSKAPPRPPPITPAFIKADQICIYFMDLLCFSRIKFRREIMKIVVSRFEIKFCIMLSVMKALQSLCSCSLQSDKISEN
jgi:hypothetical protein